MTVEERLEKLEQKLSHAQIVNRVLIVAGIGILLVMWLFASGASTAQNIVHDEILAKKFVVVDENGMPCIGLGASDIGRVLGLFDENGKPRILMSAANDGSMLALIDENGKPIWVAP